MSFILDALSKAEHKNRGRHDLSARTGPRVLMDETPDAPTNWRRLILFALAGVALLITGLLIGLRGNTPEKIAGYTPPPNSQSVIDRSASVEKTNPDLLQDPEPDTPVRNTGARSLDNEANRDRRVTTANNDQATPQNFDPVIAATPQSSRPPPGRVETETLPDYRSVLLSGQIALPKLHLDMHVYSNKQDKRFVFVNLTKYRQGEKIDDDTLIESIEVNGAILNHKGFRFLLLPD